MSVMFDPGYARHTGILSVNIEYIYASISRFKNLGQKKLQFKMYYPKILRLVDNNVAFCLGSLLWAICIKQSPLQEIINNPCLDGEYDEAEAVKEIDFSKNYLLQLKKDAKYYLGADYEINQQFIRVLDVYREFLIINKGFVNVKTTDDLRLPEGIRLPENIDVINSKIQEVVQTGKLTDLFEFYGTIL